MSVKHDSYKRLNRANQEQGKKRERKADRPAGFATEEVEVLVAKLVCSVVLDDNWKLTEASDNYLQTLGFTL